MTKRSSPGVNDDNTSSPGPNSLNKKRKSGDVLVGEGVVLKGKELSSKLRSLFKKLSKEHVSDADDSSDDEDEEANMAVRMKEWGDFPTKLYNQLSELSRLRHNISLHD